MEREHVISRNYSNDKKIKELFASTLDRIPISVRCVSSMIVVLNVNFALLLAAHANKKYG